LKPVIHVITTINRGGAENQLLVLVKQQIQEGLEVAVAYLKGTPELRNEFENLGVEVISDLALVGLIRQPLALRKIVAGKRYIVHAHLPRAEIVSFFVPSKFTLVVSRHNAEPFFPGAPKWISNALSIAVTLRARKVVAISRAVKEFIIQRGEILNQSKINVVLYGYHQIIDKEIRFGSPSLSISRFGTISRLTEQKDIPTMLRTLERIKLKNPEVTLDLVGSGPLKARLERLTKELGLWESVNFLGRTDKVIEYLRGLDAFILTSKYEGFGLVLLEAMDAGIPIVASRTSAIPEVLGDDFPGLCEPGDHNEFASKILRLSEPNYRKLFLQMQEVRLQMFDAPTMSAKIRNAYYS
jgi:glycosyltransferase involved in cell wall biosynthesis